MSNFSVNNCMETKPAAKHRARSDARVASAGAEKDFTLPADVLPAVLRHLSHDALFCALQLCKMWHAAGSAAGPAALWEEHYHQRGWQQHHQQQHDGSGQLEAAHTGQQQLQPTDWRERYRQQYSLACYQCFQPTQRHTLAVGSLRLRLCRDCSSAAASPQDHHRLLSEAASKTFYCLKQTDLDPLPRCVEPNPIDPAFSPMRLYRRLDVRRVAITRWGSWEAVQAEYWRRRKR
ncbi:hypothetical protein D9Q98_005145 [Chlorella vulgaris]|uniref:XPA C-terminal domain-containing protein n=1 Tax=Chlorella vulgaris TaxID=3077 RepID=A0A9D4TNK2_CHLVU|nr:hypothetical protein D9Q98_005145 [Chlorella vulgaris]